MSITTYTSYLSRKETKLDLFLVDISSPLLISEFTRTLLEHFIKQMECPKALATNTNIRHDDTSGTLYKLGQTVASTFDELVIKKQTKHRWTYERIDRLSNNDLY
jgi:hypothetical protein